MTVLWSELTAPQLRRLSETDAMVVVPVASTEQHGPHLPVMADALIGGEIARRAAERVRNRVPIVVAPVVWVGLAEHHLSFGGTLSVDFPTWFAVLRSLCRSLQVQGFRRVLFLNSHGGNEAALQVAVDELTVSTGMPLAACSYWNIMDDRFDGILEAQTTVLHACELETSILLALRPDLVDRTALPTARGPSLEAIAAPHGRGIHRWRAMADMTDTGVIGEAPAASAEKGERLLEAIADRLAAVLAGGAVWPASGDRSGSA